MLNTTVALLCCPTCSSELKISKSTKTLPGPSKELYEISFGELACTKCKNTFPILAGVAIVVEEPEAYLFHHVKGISKLVSNAEIPVKYKDSFNEAQAELRERGAEHIEEDLESDRVNALYLMTHYLNASEVHSDSPLVNGMVKEYWDHGPFSQIKKWMDGPAFSSKQNIVELGCGVGGLARVLQSQCKAFLGADSSFASIALARHFNLGVPHLNKTFKVPDDLLHGGLTKEIKISVPQAFDGRVDFVVCDFDELPLKKAHWDVSIALNAIDMMDDPTSLPRFQNELVHEKGIAIQSCPYIWHSNVTAKLRKLLPQGKKMSSASAVEWLYEQAGLKIKQREDHIPWLFFKHARQLEIYSVHMFMAEKS